MPKIRVTIEVEAEQELADAFLNDDDDWLDADGVDATMAVEDLLLDAIRSGGWEEVQVIA